MTPTQPNPPPSPASGFARRLGQGIHFALVGVVGLLVLAAVAQYVRKAWQAPPPAMPAAIEPVDWRDPKSSIYCVACHRQVAPAMAGLDVKRGHSQNVRLSTVQIQAVKSMDGITGPSDTLICMSCHKLGRQLPFMLADTLDESKLCQNCHPGHYAQGTPHDLRVSAPKEQNRFGVTAAVGGPCSACHLSHSFARDIIPSPEDPDGYCISCHREYGVAAGHARNKMPHPESQCLQCHNPHDDSNGNFLQQPINTQCVICHTGFDAGPQAGMHPIGAIQRDIPNTVLQAGAIKNANPREITCATCHSVHDSWEDGLLVLSKESNQLCLGCHTESLACAADGKSPAKHALMPQLNENQVAEVRGWQGAVGPNRELLCVSCHRIHGGDGPAGLLAFDPGNVANCIGCHPGESTVLRSQHDLTVANNATNSRVRVPQSGNACRACHDAHGPARDRVVTAADPSGTCTSCHREDDWAATKRVAGMQHPKSACTDCHEPHAGGLGGMLKQPEADLCVHCHADEAALIGGPHDYSATPDSHRWEKARLSGGLCLSCHVPHGGKRPDLFRLGGEPSENHDDVCLTCHSDANWRSDGAVAAIHPHEISCDESKVAAPLVPKDQAGNMRIGCRTCHNPHGGQAPIHLARVAPGTPTESLCLGCHENKSHISQTGHAPEKLASHELPTDSCKPCHAMHATWGDTFGQMLSGRFLPGANEKIGNEIDQRFPCLSCHHERGLAPLPAVVSHPKISLAVATGLQEPGYLPLFDAAGHETPEGQVTCRTCHVAHGRLELLEHVPAEAQASQAELRLMRMQVRAFVAPNICTTCHGMDGRRKFLFFHDPEKRGGQFSPPGAPRN